MPDAKKKPAPKPLTAAERARNYRARKAKEAAEAAAAYLAQHANDRDEQPPSRPSRTMLKSVESAVAAMKWIQPSDGALVDAAKLYALQIDMTLEADPTATGRAASLGQLLIRILHELGGTPTVRLQHELRSLRAQLGAQQPDGDHGDKNQERATGTNGAKPTRSNVTPITRPPKRKRQT